MHENLHRLSRRDAIKSTAAGLVAGIAAGGAGVAAEKAAFPIVDTHTHFFDPTRPQGIPWPPKGDSLYRTVLPPDFLKVASPHGVTATVVVEASPLVEDNQWLLDVADREKSIVGVVGNLTPGPDFAKNLERFAKNKLFRGIRLGDGVLAKGVGQEAFLDDLRRMADQDLSLDVVGGGGLPAVTAKIADAVPRLRIVIDHLPFGGLPKPSDPSMKEVASRGNVFAKISWIRKADLASYAAVLEELWKLFGEDRVIYGSNWPVSDRFIGPYATVFNAIDPFVRGKGPVTAEKFYSRNAHAAYKWVDRG